MAWALENIRNSLELTKAESSSPEWNSIRDMAWERLQQVGTPRPRSDAFFWIPLSLLTSPNLLKASQKQNPVLVPPPQEIWKKRIAADSDCLSIFPVLLSPNPRLLELSQSSEWQTITVETTGEYDLQSIRIQNKSKVRLFISSNSEAFTLRRLDIEVGNQCEVEVLCLQEQSDLEYLAEHVSVCIGENSSVRWFSLDCGHKLYRNSIDAHLEGANAAFEFKALSILDGENQSHRRVRVWHSAPNVHSDQMIRHVLLGSANASCDTQVEITRGTKGTKAHQLVNSLLLSPSAKASAKPTLLIHNDEVEASHGTTCGDLDVQQLFYLESRGLSKTEARRLLLTAFVESVVTAFPASEWSSRLSTAVRTSLSKRLP